MKFAVNRDKGDYKMVLEYKVSAEQALQRLKDGNLEYLCKDKQRRYITGEKGVFLQKRSAAVCCDSDLL